MRNKMIYLILGVTTLACLLYPSTSEGQEYEFVNAWPKEVLLRLPDSANATTILLSMTAPPIHSIHCLLLRLVLSIVL